MTSNQLKYFKMSERKLKMINTKYVLGMEVPVYEGTDDASTIKIVAPGCDMGFQKPIKSKEFIDLSEELVMKLIKCLPQRDELLCGDIFLSGNIFS